MDSEVQKALNVVEHIGNILENTRTNLKKCPKARLTQHYVEERLRCTEEYWNKYKQAYDEIIRNTSREKATQIPYLAKDTFYTHEEIYITLQAELKDILSANKSSACVPIPTSSENHAGVVLPKIQLPTYSGQYEEWLSFHDLFNTLVHTNRSLSNVQKLHYLKSSVTGEAASILKHIQVTDSNYEEAWDILKRRYDNKRIAINAVMKRFFSQKKITVNTSVQIKNLLDTTFECLHHLNNLQVKTDNWDPIIIFVAVQKLDPDTHKEWEEYVNGNSSNPNSLPSLEMFRKFLEGRFRTLELIEPPRQKLNYPTICEKTFHTTTSVEKNKICQICSETHTLSHCKAFGKYNPTQRSAFIKSNNRCYNCLATGHSVRQCRVPTSCRICNKRHHSLLHEQREDASKITAGTNENKQTKQPEVTLLTHVEKSEEQEEDDVTMITSHVSTKQGTSLLATALVQVRTEDNYVVTLKALIDQGSQASFISEKAAQLIKAKRYPIKGTVIGVGSTKEDIKQVVKIKLESRCEPFNMNVRTYVMSKQLTTELPSRMINSNNWPHIKGLILADPTYFEPGAIDLLLGVDVYASIIQNKLIKGPPGSPCAHKTSLGWILFGQIQEKSQPAEVVHVMHHQIIAADLKTLWEVDHDIVSRGFHISKLKYKTMWWEGPIRLKNREIDFTRTSITNTDVEKRHNIQSYITIVKDENMPPSKWAPSPNNRKASRTR